MSDDSLTPPAVPQSNDANASTVSSAVAAPPDSTPTQAPAAPERPSLWKAVLGGALTGLAGSSGATHFGGGLGAGAASVLQHQQLDIENQRAATQQASDLKFKDAQAAASVAEAARNNAVAASLPQEAKDAHDKSQIEMADQLQQLGITPTVIADDTHEGAMAGLQSLQNSQGAVPHLFNLEVGGQHLAYDLSQLSGTPQGLTAINSAREVQGLPAITTQQWRQTPKAAQSQTAEGALKFFAPPPAKNIQEATSTYLQYKGWADAYAKKPDADPATLQRLTGLLSNLKDVRDGLQKQSNQTKYTEAYANAQAQKQARLDTDRQDYQKNLTAGDVTGWKPNPGQVMSEQQFSAANNKWAGGDLAKAQDTEKGFQMFQDAYDQRGNAKTGAQSMLALSQHLANTFGSVKGNRITKEMIHEHLGARSVSDSALVATQKLTNGDVLSENQWQAFHGLITDARRLTWNNAVQNAHAMGLPVQDGVVPPDVQGKAKPAGDFFSKYGGKAR